MEELDVRIEPPLAWVIVNRPQARNALTLGVWRALASAMRTLESEDAVRVVVVRGAGNEAFIAGADITEFPAARADATMTAAYDRETAQALSGISELPKPVIAMVNGLCFGGGCSVALACDLRIAAEHARFAIPAARLGLAYPFVDDLVRAVGPSAAADILLSARALNAQEALRIGLVSRVVPGDQLETAVREYAAQVADGAPLTLAAHKAAIRAATTGHDHARVASLVAACFDSADYREGVAAFIEKRRPRFQGR